MRAALRAWLRVGLRIAVTASALSAPRDARAGRFSGVAEYTYQRQYTDGDLVFDTLWQRYSAGFRQDVSEPLSYRLFLNYDQTLTPVMAPGTKTRSKGLNPQAAIAYHNGNLSLQLTYLFNWAETDTGKQISDQRSHQLTVSGTYRLNDRFSVGGGAQRIIAVPDGSPTTYSDRLQESATYGGVKVQAGQSMLVLHQTQSDDAYDRLMMSQSGNLGYGDTFFNDALVVGATESASYNWLRERSHAAAGSVNAPRTLVPARALFVQTPLPIDTTSTPMTAVAALIDRDLDNSAGVDLGPNGVSFNNLAVDMGRTARVDEIAVYVRDASQRFVTDGGTITWSAWYSQDGRIWTQTSVQPCQPPFDKPFDKTLSRYLVCFSAPDARYFKVVNFGVNLLPALVTEMEAIIHESIAAGDNRVSSGLSNTFGANTFLRPASFVGLSYGGSVQNTTQSSPSSDLATFSWNHGATAAFGPFRSLSPVLFWNQAQSRVRGSPTLDTMGAGGGVSWLPSTRFNFNLGGSWTRQTYDDTRVEEASGSASLGLQPLETMSVQANSSLSRNHVNDVSSTSIGAGGGLSLVLRPNLTLGGTGTMQRIISGEANVPVGIPINRIQVYQAYGGSLTYTASRQLSLSGRIGYFKVAPVSGLTEGVSISWIPVVDGQVSLRATYSHDVDSTSGIVSRRARLDANWTVSRWIYLGGSYTDERASVGVPRQAIFAYLNLHI